MYAIEKYEINESGYSPFLIRKGWQIAQLNYMEEQKIENLHRLEVHNHTDEVFILLEGKAVLISANINEDRYRFKIVPMKSLVTYNVPRGCWHNIAMLEGSKVIIVEKSNTHITDVEYFELTKEKIKLMKRKVRLAFSEYIV